MEQLSILNSGLTCEVCQDAIATHIDHCHNLGHKRGYTCIDCNTLLGYIEKLGRDTVSRAFQYLDEDTDTPGIAWTGRIGGT